MSELYVRAQRLRDLEARLAEAEAEAKQSRQEMLRAVAAADTYKARLAEAEKALAEVRKIAEWIERDRTERDKVLTYAHRLKHVARIRGENLGPHTMGGHHEPLDWENE